MHRPFIVVLKVVCLALAANIGLQVFRGVTDKDPLAGLAARAEAVRAASVAAPGPPAPSSPSSPLAAAGPGDFVGPPPSASAAASASTAPSGQGAAPSTSPPPGKEGAPPPPPDRYRAIEVSGILGILPKGPPPPALLGLAGRYAIIRAPDGRTDLVAEGGEMGGVKVIRIELNRALIEYQGKREELSIFSGMGSHPIVPPGKEPSTR